jgi:hypothetical protein
MVARNARLFGIFFLVAFGIMGRSLLKVRLAVGVAL